MMTIQNLDDKHRYMMFDQNVMKEYIPPSRRHNLEIITRTDPKLSKHSQLFKVADSEKVLKMNFSKFCHPRRRLWGQIESMILPDHVLY